MAAAVVTVIVDVILQSLEEGMELRQQWGVEHEIIEIRDLLSSVRGKLPEVEDKYGRSLDLQKWVRNLKHAAFVVEDLLEELSVEDALWQHETKVHRLLRAIHRLKFWWRIRDELRDVARLLQDLIRSDWVGLLRNIPDDIGETHEAAVAVPLIGRDREKRDLMRLLCRGYFILVVEGARGIGKTALVQKVLSESELNRHFDVIIWVNASPPFDESRMARDIIACLTNGVATEEENVLEEQLLVRIKKLLDGRKKYLFILDDLPENIVLLDHLPEEWLRDFTCLEELHIGSCPSLVSLSWGMMYLEKLESLSIWNCEELDLSKDEHGKVMMEPEGLRSLKFLTIYKSSKMEYLPVWLFRVNTLRFLFIRSCPNLVALPEWIGNLESLKLIELVHCPRLTSLPAWMHEFTNDHPQKLSIIGCPLLQIDWNEHFRSL